MKALIEQVYFPNGKEAILTDVIKTVCIVPRSDDHARLKSLIHTLHTSKGKKSSVIPEISTLFDFACTIAEVDRGGLIREIDFHYLMAEFAKTKEGQLIPGQFTKEEFTGYKKYLFALLNYILFSDEKIDIYKKLEKTGLTKEVADVIVQFIRSKGFLFRADVYRTALKKIKSSPDLKNDKRFFLFEGEYYTKLEKELLNVLECKTITHSTNSNVKTKFIKVSNPAEQFQYIYNKLRQHADVVSEKIDFAKYAVYCSTEKSAHSVTSYLVSKGIPVLSPAKTTYRKNESLIIDAFDIAQSRSVKAAVTWFNLHCSPKLPVSIDTGKSEPDLGIFTHKIAQNDAIQKNEYSVKFTDTADRSKFVNFMELFSKMADFTENKSGKSKKSTDDLFKELDNLSLKLVAFTNEHEIEKDLSPFSMLFSESVKKILGDSPDPERMMRYISEVSSTRYQMPLSENFTGVWILTPDSLFPPVENLFVIDLEDSTFLRDQFTNKLLDHEDYLSFEKEIYGENKEKFFKIRFDQYIKSDMSNVEYVLPAYNEGTIISRHITNECETQSMTVQVLGTTIKNFAEDFSKNLLDDAVKPELKPAIIKPEDLFAVTYKGNENIIELLKKNLHSATTIESFIQCPAKFIHELQDEYNTIDSTDRFDRGNAFHEFISSFLKSFKGKELLGTLEDVKGLITKEKKESKKGEVEKTVKAYMLSSGESHLFVKRIFDEVNVNSIFTVLKERFKELHLTEKDLFSYLVFAVRFIIDTIGISGSDVTSTFRFEVQLGNYPVVDTGLILQKSYADFIFIDKKGTLQIIDFKSGDIKKYKDEFNSYHVTQLPFYWAILKAKDSVFLSLTNPKENSETIDTGYLNGVKDFSYAYVSCKDGYGCQSCKESPEDYFTKLIEKLSVKLNDAYTNKFIAESNSSCDYCHLSDFCQSKEMPVENTKTVSEKDKFKDFPLVKEGIDDKEVKSIPVKKMIQFYEDKAKGVSIINKDIVISAGAGAGKTEVLSSRFINILMDGTPLEEIVCITFTNKAAGEMKKRILSKIDDTLAVSSFYAIHRENDDYRLNEAQLKNLTVARENFYDKNRITTFHSFCMDILDRYRKNTINPECDLDPSVADAAILQAEKISILNKHYATKFEAFVTDENEKKELDEWLCFQIPYYENEGREGGIIPDILNFIDTISLSGKSYQEALIESADDFFNRKISCSSGETNDKKDSDREYYIRKALIRIAQGVEKELDVYKKSHGQIELTDFHKEVIKLFAEDADILKDVQKSIKHLLIDEFQDTNWLQKKIIDYIHPDIKTNCLFIVGDLKQSVYRFQQCDNQIFKVFRDKQNVEYLTFPENRRSIPDIINFNNYFFSDNKMEAYNIFKSTSKDPKSFELAEYPKGKKVPEYDKPVITFAQFCFEKNDNDESADMKNLVKMNEASYITETIKNSKVDYDHWGILIRTYTHVHHVIDALKKAEIPYSFVIKRDFFLLPEVCEMVLMLKVICGISHQNEISYNDILSNLLLRLKQSWKHNQSLTGLLNEIVASDEYNKVLSKNSEAKDILEHIFTLREIIQDIEKDTAGSIVLLFERLSMKIAANSEGIESNRDGAVKIMTVHSSKGLEFDHLIVVNLGDSDATDNEIIKFINKVEKNGNWIDHSVSGIKRFNGEIEPKFLYNDLIKSENKQFTDVEKANLLYVAFTRAKKTLIVTMLRGSIDTKTKPIHNCLPNWLKNIENNLFENFAQEPFFGTKEKSVNNVKIQLQRILVNTLSQNTKTVSDTTGNRNFPDEKRSIANDKISGTILTGVTKYIKENKNNLLNEDKIENRTNDTEYEGKGGSIIALRGTLLHEFFEKNIHILAKGIKNNEKLIKDFLEGISENDVMKNQLRSMITNCINNKDFIKLISDAENLYQELNIVFTDSEAQGYVFNAYLDLVIEYSDRIIILDYKTHFSGKEPDTALVSGYMKQLEYYEKGLSALFQGKKIEKVLFFTGKENAVLRY